MQLLKKIWIRKCKRKDKFNPISGRICSEHFTPDDYVKDLQHELLGLPIRKKLKTSAVPSKNLSPSSLNPSKASAVNNLYIPELQIQNFNFQTSRSETSNSRTSRSERRNIRKNALARLANIAPINRHCDQSTNTEEESEYKKLKKEVQMLKQRNDLLMKAVNNQKNIGATLKQRIVLLEKERKSQDEKNSSFTKSKIFELFGKVFTECQIKCILNKKLTMHWDSETIAKALTMRAISQKMYCLLRKKFFHPLPGLTTLRRWTKSIKCHAGILDDVLILLEQQGKSMTELEKICVLSFDKMNINSKICYDQEQDTILGPHTYVQVCLLRGMFSDWKQPIYYHFDTPMSRKILFDIIHNVEKIGFEIYATICNLGLGNAALLKSLDVSPTEPWFPNPENISRRIWTFVDVPHLLKLLRNNFIDYGIILSSGKLLTKDTLINIIHADSGGSQLHPKLTPLHLTCQGRDRQSVYLAAQLFSRHTAKAIEKLYPEEKEASDFFLLVNDTFDILNSRSSVHENPYNCGFGLHFEQQQEVLEKFFTECSEMRVSGKPYLLPFQKGFLMSIRALQGMHEVLQSKGTISILCSKLNQDCLENFFLHIRGWHFYDHPSPTEVRNRIRLLILGADAVSVVTSSETSVALKSSETFESCLTKNMFEGISNENLQQTQNSCEEINNLLMDSSCASNQSQIRVEHNSETSDCPEEGLRYLAGYVAFRVKSSGEILGHSTMKIVKPNTEISEQVGWIEILSRGGLMVPTEDWLKKVKEFEAIFCAYHGHELCRETGLMNNMSTILSEKYPNISKDAVKLYVRTRTFIRIRHLNLIVMAQNNSESTEKPKKAKKRKKSILNNK